MSDIIWESVTVTLDKLVPWDRNPKTISKDHARRLLDLWKKIGQFQTLAIGPNYELYDGHQRLPTLMSAFGPDFEVDARQSSRPLTEKEREELTVAAHVGTTGQFNWNEFAGWDSDELEAWGLNNDQLISWDTDATNLRAMLAASAAANTAAPEEFPEYDEKIETEYRCPKCGYQWSGKAS